jgi:hypothetical protein
MIWVQCKRETDEDRVGYSTVDCYPYLGTDNPTKREMPIEHNPVRCTNLGSVFTVWAPHQDGYCISLIHRDAYLRDGSANNGSISVSVGASGPIPYQYRGPMIAIRRLPHEFCDDIKLCDFRHLIDYLVSYRSTHVREYDPNRDIRAPLAMRGVRITCQGEVELHASEAFVPVEITRATRITFGGGSLSPISARLGMPLVLWKDSDLDFLDYPPGCHENMNASSNTDVAFLMLETDPSKSGWGWAPLYWNMEICNVYVLREDGNDLSVHDLEMMCHFARDNLQRRFEDALESGPGPREKQEVLDFITWENMVKHWEKNGDGTGEL